MGTFTPSFSKKTYNISTRTRHVCSRRASLRKSPVSLLRNTSLWQAKEYRAYWKEDLWESEDSEVFGFNEFIGGKAEAYEDCLEMVRRFQSGF